MTAFKSSVRFDRIELRQPPPEPIRDLSLERPVVGGEWTGPTLEVSGWILGTEGPPSSIEIRHAGKPIRRIPVRQRRLDVARRFPDAPDAERSGFTGTVSTLGLPAELRLEMVAVLAGGARVPLGFLEGRREPLRPGFEPVLQPIMVTTLGRMASTWMMSLLASHPQIVALRRYPYECKTAKYWLQVLATLAEPAMQAVDAEPVHADRWWVGANPFLLPDLVREPRPGVGLYGDRMARACKRNIDDWYSELAFHQVKGGARYFAEKMTPNRLPPLMRELYPEAKEVFLVRDFRDWISSILAFDAQRGFHGFGRREGEPTVDYVRRHGRYALELQAHWEARRGDAHLVRYEDLVREPEATLRSLFEYLGVTATPACVEATLEEARTESESYPHHRTSSDNRTSVGRWRRRLEPEVREVAQTVFADVLRSFGYDAEEAGLAAASDAGAGSQATGQATGQASGPAAEDRGG